MSGSKSCIVGTILLAMLGRCDEFLTLFAVLNTVLSLYGPSMKEEVCN